MVKRLLPGAEIRRADAADALAVAICHAHHRATPHRARPRRRRRRPAVIAKLTGRLDGVVEGGCVLDVNGVGYLVVLLDAHRLRPLPPPPERARGAGGDPGARGRHHPLRLRRRAERDAFRALTAHPGRRPRGRAGHPFGALARRAGRGGARRRQGEPRPRQGRRAEAGRTAGERNCATGPGRSRSAAAAAPRPDAAAPPPAARRNRAGSGCGLRPGQSRLAAAGSGGGGEPRRRPARRRGAARRGDPRQHARTGTPMSDDDAARASPPASGRRRTPARTRLRPQTLDDFIGQQALRENLEVFIDAARGRAARRWTTSCCYGPPGLGKTTLAQIVARELGVGFRATSGPILQRAGDLAAILTNLQPRDVLFIDEIHRLQPAIEETLYPAMEDFRLDLIIGEGPAARTVRIDLPPFTLVGATTRAGLLSHAAARPLRHPAAAAILHAGRAAARSSAAAPSKLELRAVGGRRAGDRPPLPRHAARRRPPAAPRARLRRGGGRCRPTAPSPTRRWSGWRWTRSASTPWTAATSAASPSTTMAARSASRPWPPRWPRARDTHRGGDRALPDPGRAGAAHPARPDAGRPRLAPPRPGAARRQPGGAARPALRRRRTRCSDAPALASRSASTSRTPTPAAWPTTPPICAGPSGRGRKPCARPGSRTRSMMERHGAILVVRRIEVEYVRPARLDDAADRRDPGARGQGRDPRSRPAGAEGRRGPRGACGWNWPASTARTSGRAAYPNPGGRRSAAMRRPRRGGGDRGAEQETSDGPRRGGDFPGRPGPRPLALGPVPAGRLGGEGGDDRAAARLASGSGPSSSRR